MLPPALICLVTYQGLGGEVEWKKRRCSSCRRVCGLATLVLAVAPSVACFTGLPLRLQPPNASHHQSVLAGAAGLAVAQSSSVASRAAADGGAFSDGASGQPGDEDAAAELLRQSMLASWGGTGVAEEPEEDWAEEIAMDDTPELQPGDVLLARPDGFIRCGMEFSSEGDNSDAGPHRVGMEKRIDSNFQTKENLYLTLPVVLLTRVDDEGAEGVLLSKRTGKLMGDFMEHFMTRPIYFGGPEEANLTVIHPYPEVPDCRPLGESGLCVSSDFNTVQQWAEEDGDGSFLHLRFFMQKVSWGPGDLSKELEAPATWIPLRCSTDVVLADADSGEETSVWLRVAELAGKKYGTKSYRAILRVEELGTGLPIYE
eukprot:TRINITY_DN6889_c0_g1_i4.p1 TRINITY_DN6889_c0_g1~~TRINITY_DN6889_c0_g1_i4.p1  ORF type:complete len:371 (-),score=60.50 TRINITY_DN6889_c0_g1_i4:250-1362(-)